MKTTLFVSAALATALLSACGDNKTTTEATKATTAPDATTGAATLADSAKKHDMSGMSGTEVANSTATGSLTGAMAKMMQQMNANKPIGNTDHDFSHLMMAHHQGAIDMAQVELRDGKDATLKAMARKISDDQTQERAALDKAAERLDGAAKNYAPQDPRDKFRAGMDASMKIMMQPMAPSGNPDLDFARMMAAHHQAAIAMSQTEVALGQDAEVKQMAQMSIVQQGREIQQFNDWLAKNGGQGKM